MKAMLKKLQQSPHRKTIYVLCYTALFSLCALLVFCHFLLAGKSFVWSGNTGNQDGISQHYIALSYWGSYLRDILRTLLTEGRWSIPLFDASIGMGSDVIQTLSYYVIGDPLTLLSIFVPRAYTEYLYNFLILFRLYLAGLAFSAFALHLKKNNRFFTLIASMIYVFSAYTLHAAVRHPFFSNPMIYFPLVLLGVEYIFQGKKPWLFIFSVTLAALSNFYFCYMICILTVLYVLVRMFDYCPKGQRKKIGGYLSRFALYGLLAIMMAGVLFYPSLHAILSSSRQSGGGSVPLFYPADHYLKYIFSMATAETQTTWDFHGFLPLSLLALFLLWTTRKKGRTEKILFVACTVIFLIPALGWILNGTAYVSNRWCWGYSLLIACICAFRLPALPHLSKKKWAVLIVGSLLYVYGTVWLNLTSLYYRFGNTGLLLSVLLCGAILVMVGRPQLRQGLLRGAMLVLVIMQVADFGLTRYKLDFYTNEFVDSGKCFENTQQAQAAPLTVLEDTCYHRYENVFSDDPSKQQNTALIHGGHSTEAYFSLSNDNWYELLRSLGHRDTTVQQITGLDNRTVLCALSNVKYLTTNLYHSDNYIPYGYGKDPLFTAVKENSQLYKRNPSGLLSKESTYAYYLNEHALPFGYTYDSYITRDQYNTLSYTDRQRALLHHAVLEQDSSLLAKGTLPDATAPLHIQISCDPTVTRQGDTFTTYQSGKIYITLSGAQANRETYLSFKNMQYKQYDSVTNAKLEGRWDSLTDYEQQTLTKSAASFSPAKVIPIHIAMDDLSKTVTYQTPDYTYYAGVHDFSVNLGLSSTAPTTICITLPQSGSYTLEDITVTQLDLSDYEAQTEKLKKEHLENVIFADNRVSGDITVSENKLLCLSLPYSEGWTAYVDGKETLIQKTDLSFMGIELSPGTHRIELRYFTPHLAVGIALSILGWSIWIVWFIVDHIINKKDKQKEGIPS